MAQAEDRGYTPDDIVIGQLFRKLDDIEQRIRNLEQGSRVSQLEHATIDTTSGPGYIPVLGPQGKERARIGRMPDGTITTISVGNTTPPSRPETPFVIPVIGGLMVSVENLLGPTPYDFSHIRVYIDGLLDGTIIKIPGIWIAAPLDTSTTHTVQITAVNQSGTESPKSDAVIAKPLAVIDELGPIDETKIEDDSISTPKLKALAITAAKIAANAIEATHIKAGSVTASKLESVIVLASQIIAGTAGGKRITIDSTGITQFDAKGNIQIQLGVTSTNGNTFTIIDPDDSSNALASIAADGTVNSSGLSVNGKAYLNGIDLVAFLNSLPRGLVAKSSSIPNTPSITGNYGWYEFGFDAVAGRSYKFTSDPMSIRYDGSGSNAPAAYVCISATQDGSAPRIVTAAGQASSLLCQITLYASSNQNSPSYIYWTQTMTPISAFITATVTGKIRCLLYVAGAGPGNCVIGGTGDKLLNLIVEDIGFGPGFNIGGSNNGQGSSGAVQQYVTTYPATYTLYAGDQTGNTNLRNGLQQGKLGNENFMSMIGFNQSTIASNLQSAVIRKVELYLYSNYWTESTGGVTCIGTHNVSGTPTAYAFTSRDISDQPMKKPQGVWLEVPNSIATQLANNAIKGLVLDARNSNPTTQNYGIFRDNGWSDTSMRPQLRITYTK